MNWCSSRIIAAALAAWILGATDLGARAQPNGAPGYMPARPSIGTVPVVPPAPVTPTPAGAPPAEPATAPAPAISDAPGIPLPPVADVPPSPPPVPQAMDSENPYGLGALWAEGDFVARTTLLVLVIMSVGTWYLVAMRLWDQQVLIRQARTVATGFWSARSLNDGLGSLEPDSAYRSIVESGLRAADHREGRLTDRIDSSQWIAMAIARAVDGTSVRLQTGLAFMASVASTAPFVGLFGTVWGIYHALIAIGVAGQASIDKVAGPVGEALIMTAIGLLVAVPAVLFYNWLGRRNKVVLDHLRNFAADVQAVLQAGRS